MLLSEIYDDVTLDDAPYFSALYGPSRHAIVVPDLSLVREQLDGLEECPEDLYLIEGDPQSFDDSVFSVDELQNAVVVKVAERQWRYSRFPKIPLFGRAARETSWSCSITNAIVWRNGMPPCRLTFKDAAASSVIQPFYR